MVTLMAAVVSIVATKTRGRTVTSSQPWSVRAMPSRVK